MKSAYITVAERYTHRRAYAWLVFALFACACAMPGVVHAEYVQLLDARIEVRKDSSFHVTEKIEYVFTKEQHGISRCIKTTHSDPASSVLKERYIEIEDVSALLDGAAVPHDISKGQGVVCVTVGDPNAMISGPHTYTISYAVYGAISYPQYGGADLYWNVTGDAWEVPIQTVKAEITSPDGLLFPERSCSQGTLGKILSCSIQGGTAERVSFGGNNLAPKSSLTISQALNRTAIARDIRESYRPLVLGIGGGFILLLAIVYLGYRHTVRRNGDLMTEK